MITAVTKFKESKAFSIKRKINPKQIMNEKINKFDFLRKIKFKNILKVNVSAKISVIKKANNCRNDA